MNRYPLWKYILIGVALVVALLYTLPNFFGEVPAVQVSPVRATLKADSALLARIQDVLQQNKITADGIFLDATSVKARFEDTETQYRARDALQKALGDDYVVALNLLSRNPQWLASIGALPMYLGLDLRGGVHFLLQVDMKGALSKKIDAFTNDIRGAPRRPEPRRQIPRRRRPGQGAGRDRTHHA
jgi:preprotein translocase subunit SecD